MVEGAAVEDEDSPSQLKSIPSVLWSQIYHRLGHFLERGVGAGGYPVLRWSHRHTAEFVAARYLSSTKKIESISRTLADYFMETPQQSQKGGENSKFL